MSGAADWQPFGNALDNTKNYHFQNFNQFHKVSVSYYFVSIGRSFHYSISVGKIEVKYEKNKKMTGVLSRPFLILLYIFSGAAECKRFLTFKFFTVIAIYLSGLLNFLDGIAHGEAVIQPDGVISLWTKGLYINRKIWI